MLVLSRKLDESILIGEDFKVTVLGIKGKQIRLGIDAPRDVSVHRKEVYMRITDSLDAPAFNDDSALQTEATADDL